MLPVKCLLECFHCFVGATPIPVEFSFPPVELPLNYLRALFSKTSRSLGGGEALPVRLHTPPASRNPFISPSWVLCCGSPSCFEPSRPSAFRHYANNTQLNFCYVCNTPFLIKTTCVVHLTAVRSFLPYGAFRDFRASQLL